jgi:hypothetical protein
MIAHRIVKRPYSRPKVRVLTPDQAGAEAMAKAVPGSQQLRECFKLIAETRKRS